MLLCYTGLYTFQQKINLEMSYSWLGEAKAFTIPTSPWHILLKLLVIYVFLLTYCIVKLKHACSVQ